MNFSIIGGVDDKLGIGKNNDLPWRLGGDLRYFAKITIGAGNNAVLMGRNTWISLPEKFRPLPGRLNAVLSPENDLDLPPGVLWFPSFDAAFEDLGKRNLDEIFVIGGAGPFAEGLKRPECNKLYLTRVSGDFGCDRFFSPLPERFKLVSESSEQEENGIKYRFTVYEA